jgi:hypothetical protein
MARPSEYIGTLTLVLLVMAGINASAATAIPAPSGQVLLSISGNINQHNDGKLLQMDLEMLEALPAYTFTTNTPWTDEPTEFTGVRIKHLLVYAGAGSTEFRALASDKYWNDLKEMDFDNIPAIVAYKRNGQYMRLRDLGPLWLMFPFDEFPEISTEKYKTACVWQLIGIEVY